MPYASTAELPADIRSKYGACAAAFKGAFNAAYAEYGEARAFAIAHASARACQRRRVTESALVEHLPGKHDQKTHGRRGAWAAALTGTPEVEAQLARFAQDHRGDRGGETIEVYRDDGAIMFHREAMGQQFDPYARSATYGVDLDDVPDGAWAGMTVVHNHPGGWDYPADDLRHGGNSFSKSDMAMFRDGDVKLAVIITPTGEYRMAPSGPWPAKDPFRSTLMMEDSAVRSVFEQRIEQGFEGWGATREERAVHAEAEHWDTVCEQVATDWGLSYGFEAAA